MNIDKPSVLVLGGTAFIGRNFCEAFQDMHGIPFALLNRKRTNPSLFSNIPRIICDRNNSEECKAKLGDTRWDAIVDFSGQQDHQIRNILGVCECDHYTFVSSSAVDRSWPSDPLFPMAQNKLWCENLIERYVSKLLIIRPGFVCGRYDYTERFEEIEGIWYWKGTKNPVQPMVRVEFLARTMVKLIRERRTGIVRAGYQVP